LPNAGGFNHIGTIEPDQVFTYEMDWQINNVYNIDELRIIAFAQDNMTKEVIQAGWADVTGKTINNIALGVRDETVKSIYPNPVDTEFNIDLGNFNKDSSLKWMLLDQTGKLMLNGIVKNGASILSVNAKTLLPGLYFFQLYTDNKLNFVDRILINR
jgi:hypothetical protein